MFSQFRILLFFIVFFQVKVHATAWDEPWADQVIKQANSFVLAKVVSNDIKKGIKLYIIKTLAGDKLSDSIMISNFYLLHLCSSSGEGVEFQTEPIDSCYFFIRKNDKGQYCIATPTTGYDYVYQNNVVATFRHSYHQASVPVDVYEPTMTAVFNNYHGISYDKQYIMKFVTEHLQKKPAGFSPDEINTFYLQHAALECVYHLNLPVELSLVLPFLNDTKNFHNQVSAARAMRAVHTPESKKELIRVLQDTSRRDFVHVMCIWSLSELKPIEWKTELRKLEETASDESDGFGGNIMDPRVCTHFPSLKSAIKELLDSL